MSCDKCRSKKQFRIDKNTKVRIHNGHVRVVQYQDGVRGGNETYLPIDYCPFCGEKLGSDVK